MRNGMAESTLLSKIKISIIVPVYNVEKFVYRCLESIGAQSFFNWECILIDDNSKDNSLKVIKQFLKANKNIADKFILHSHSFNQGTSVAHNTALSYARGEYIICVDSDDWLEKDYLKKLYEEARKTDADIVGCDYFREYFNQTEVCENFLSTDPIKALSDIVSTKTQSFLWIKLLKRELFLKYNICWPKNIDITEDLLVCQKLFSKAKKISYINEPLYHYNLQNFSSLTSTLSENKILQVISATNLLQKELGDDLNFDLPMKKRKAFSKIWILHNAEKIKKEYLALWNTDKLYRTEEISIGRKVILFLCCCHIYGGVKFILKLRKFI